MTKKTQAFCQRPITFFIPALNGGGAQRVIVNLANSILIITKHPVHIVLASAQGEFLEEVSKEVKIIDLGTGRASRSIFALAKYLKKEKPIVLCSTLNYANVCASISWHLAWKPCRLVLRESNVVRQPQGYWLERVHCYTTQFLMRLFYCRANRVVALGKGVAATLLERRICKPENIEIIGNPVIVDSSTADDVNDLGLSQSWRDRYIVAVGRLAWAKGFDVLIESFANVKDTNFDLVILGEGDLRAELESQVEKFGVSDRVYLPGFVKKPYSVIERAQLFILPSRWEGLPNALLEAMSLGVPVVSTRCPGEAASVVLDGKLGHLVPPDDPEALAVAITEALVSPRGTKEERMNRASDFAALSIARQYLEKAFELEAK